MAHLANSKEAKSHKDRYNKPVALAGVVVSRAVLRNTKGRTAYFALKETAQPFICKQYANPPDVFMESIQSLQALDLPTFQFSFTDRAPT